MTRTKKPKFKVHPFAVRASQAETYRKRCVAHGAQLAPAVWRLAASSSQHLSCRVGTKYWMVLIEEARHYTDTLKPDEVILEKGLHVLHLPTFDLRFDQSAWRILNPGVDALQPRTFPEDSRRARQMGYFGNDD